MKLTTERSLQVSRTVAPALCLFCLLFSCARSPQARRDKFIAQGQRYLNKGDYARAILQFKNAVAALPNDPESYYELGLASENAGDLSTAVASFQRALKLQPSHPGAQLKLAEILADANGPTWLHEAETRLRALMQNSPATPEMLNTLALTELKLGKKANAMEDLQLSLRKAPGGLSASILLAKMKLLDNDLAGAEKILQQAREANPNSADTYVVLGRFYASQNDGGKAEQDFQHALQIDPKNGTALMSLASLQLAAGQTREAGQNFQRLSRMNDKRYTAVYGQFLMQQGRKDEAIKEFQRLAEADPGDREARTRLVLADRLTNRIPEARKILDDALAQNPKDSDALLQRAELYLAIGNLTSAELDLNEMIEEQPNSADAHYVRAKLYEARRQDLSYRQELAEALRLNPSLIAVRVELAEAYIGAKSPQSALDLFDSAPAGEDQSPTFIAGRNWALWAMNDMPAMRKGIDAGLAIQRSPDLLIQDGMWQLRAGNPNAARAAIEQALRINPINLRALSALNASYVAEHQQALALQKIQEYARTTKSAPVEEFLGLLMLANGQRAQARAAFARAFSEDPAYVQAELSLVQMDAVENKWDDAAVRLKDVVSKDPNNATALIWLGDVAIQTGNRDTAIEAYRKAAAANPDNPAALNNLASLLDERKQPDQALPLAQKAEELAPKDPAVADTLGLILYHKGLYGMATQYLKRAEAGGDNATWKYHLAMAYARQGDIKDARQTLQAALRRDPNAPEAKLATSLVNSSK